jgi:hypothetical protein
MMMTMIIIIIIIIIKIPAHSRHLPYIRGVAGSNLVSDETEQFHLSAKVSAS